MSGKGSVYDDFLEFRAVIVQAVALSWRDSKFKERFKENPKKAMKEYFEYDFPFRMNFIWDDTLKDEDYRWYPKGTGAWVGPSNKLELILPPKPEQGQETIALAAYHLSNLAVWDEGQTAVTNTDKEE